MIKKIALYFLGKLGYVALKTSNLSNERNQNAAKLIHSSQMIENLQQSLEGKTSERKEIAKKLVQQITEFRKLTEILEGAQLAKEASEQKAAEINERNLHFISKMGGLSTALKHERNSHSLRVEEVNELSYSLESLTADLGHERLDHESDQKKLQEKEAELARLAEEANKLNGTLKALTADLEHERLGRESDRKTLGEKEAELDRLTAEVGKLNGTLDALTADLGNERLGRQSDQKTLQEKEAELAKLTEEANRLNASVDTLTADLGNERLEFAITRKALEIAEAEAKTASDARKAHQETIRSFAEERGFYEKTLDKIFNKYNKILDKKEELQNPGTGAENLKTTLNKSADRVDEKKNQTIISYAALTSPPFTGAENLVRYLGDNLDFSIITTPQRFFPNDFIDAEYLENNDKENGNRKDRVFFSHIDASPRNIEVIKSIPAKMLLYLIDPRQILINRICSGAENVADGSFVSPPLPESIATYSLHENLDWQIEHFLPLVVDWMVKWLNIANSSTNHPFFLLMEEELVNKNSSVALTLGNFLEIDGWDEESADRLINAVRTFPQYRTWETMYDARQKKRAAEIIPDILTGHFG